MATAPASPYRAPAAPLRADRVVINRARSDVYAEGRGAHKPAS